MEVSAPPVPRLFRRTLYGTSFWARFLFEHCACLRPVHRVAAWMSGQGLAVSPGTLANSPKHFVPLPSLPTSMRHLHPLELLWGGGDENRWSQRENRWH